MRKVIGSCGHIAQYDMRHFKGRMFATTDTHGHYDLLHHELQKVSFDSEKDILFVGGDWTDRGPDSKYVLDYLNEPWIQSIQGNHEAMFMEAWESNFDPDNRSVRTLKAHGGDWIWSTDKVTLDMIYKTFSELPLAIEILLPKGKKIGMVHAEVPYNDWKQFTNITKAELEWDGKATAQWARTWYSTKYQGTVNSINLVIVGHTPTDSYKPELHGNMLFLDSGCHWTDELNLIEITENMIGEYK